MGWRMGVEMRGLWMTRCGLVVAMAALIMGGATAATAADCPPPAKGGKEIAIVSPMDEPTRLGIAMSTFVALVDSEGGDWPRDVVKETESCRLGDIQVGKETVTLWSGHDRAPPVWAKTSDGRLAFIAVGPSIEEAYALYKKPSSDGSITLKQKPAFVLAVSRGEIWRYVSVFYDGLPPLDVLKADIERALTGQIPLVATYHAPSKAVTLERPSQSGRNAVMFGPLPDGKGSAFLGRGDGDYFVDTPDGAARMTASGFRCPAEFGEFKRMDLLLVNVSTDLRDQGCRYILGGNWFSLFVTRIPDPSFDIAGEIASRVKTANTGPGVPTPMNLPAGYLGQAWRDREGSGQALMMTRRGPYIVEFRATFLYQDQSKVVASAGLVAAEAGASVPQ
jgi:hypothetical protein